MERDPDKFRVLSEDFVFLDEAKEPKEFIEE